MLNTYIVQILIRRLHTKKKHNYTRRGIQVNDIWCMSLGKETITFNMRNTHNNTFHAEYMYRCTEIEVRATPVECVLKEIAGMQLLDLA